MTETRQDELLRALQEQVDVNDLAPALLRVVVESLAGGKSKQTVPHIAIPEAALLREFRALDDEQLVARWATWEQNAERTRVVYARHMREFLRFLGGSPVRDVTVSRMVSYKDFLERHRRPALALASRKAHIAAIANFYTWLRLHDDRFTANPAADIRLPQVKPQRRYTLTGAEVDDLLDARTNERCRVSTYILVYAGLRNAELADLRWRDVDMDARILHVKGKGEKERTVPMHPHLFAALDRWRDECARLCEVSAAIRVASSREETAFVLLSRTGRQLSTYEVWRSLKRRATKAGVRTVRDDSGKELSELYPHALRRTLATHLLQTEQVPLDIVADILGHNSVDTTRSHYAFSTDARTRKAIERFRA